MKLMSKRSDNYSRIDEITPKLIDRIAKKKQKKKQVSEEHII